MADNNSIYGSLDDLFLFSSVAECGSVSKAAARLNLPASTLSRRLSALEKKMGTKLLMLSRRELVPTEAGRRLFESVCMPLWEIDAAAGRFSADSASLSGTVRLTVPRAFYYDVLRATLRRMLADFPGIAFSVTTNQFPEQAFIDRKTDIILAFSLDGLEDFVAKPLYRTKLGIYVSERFFDSRPGPETLEDLAHYPWVGNYEGHEVALFAEDRPAAVLPVKPRLVVNDIHAACDEVRAGNGIGLVPIGKAKKHRELVRIFPAFNGRIRQAWLVYRKTNYMPAIITETVRRIEAASLSWFSRNNDWALEHENVRPDWPECRPEAGGQPRARGEA